MRAVKGWMSANETGLGNRFPGSLMRALTRLLLVTCLLLGCVGCDQVTKGAARAYLSDAPARSYLKDAVRTNETRRQDISS